MSVKTILFSIILVQSIDYQVSSSNLDDSINGVNYSLGCLGSGFTEDNKLNNLTTFDSLPNSIDWRDVNGSNWVTPIKDQGFSWFLHCFRGSRSIRVKAQNILQ